MDSIAHMTRHQRIINMNMVKTTMPRVRRKRGVMWFLLAFGASGWAAFILERAWG